MGLLSPQIFLNPCSPLQGPPGVPLDLPATPPVILFFGTARLVRWLAPEDRRERRVYCSWYRFVVAFIADTRRVDYV